MAWWAVFVSGGSGSVPGGDFTRTAEFHLDDELVAKMKRDFADVGAKCSPSQGQGIFGG